MRTEITNHTVTEHRPPKEEADIFRPYHYLHEQEIQKSGEIKPVNTIFLTNKECPFKCVMCDLWRNTTDTPTPKGAIPRQINYALSRLPDAEVIKLYNSGNFFDGKAIPRTDYAGISELVSGYGHVVVENHPKMVGPFIPDFRSLLNGALEIAMGLETIHPEVLPKLNKQISPDLFKESAAYLNSLDIDVRAFILLNPPFLTGEDENIDWCLRSVDFAFDAGVTACTIIPTRGGNGIMDYLEKMGQFVPPSLSALEHVFDEALSMNRGRVFCDVWDLEIFSECGICLHERKLRLEQMNLEQVVLPKINCNCV